MQFEFVHIATAVVWWIVLVLYYIHRVVHTPLYLTIIILLAIIAVLHRESQPNRRNTKSLTNNDIKTFIS